MIESLSENSNTEVEVFSHLEGVDEAMVRANDQETWLEYMLSSCHFRLMDDSQPGRSRAPEGSWL